MEDIIHYASSPPELSSVEGGESASPSFLTTPPGPSFLSTAGDAMDEDLHFETPENNPPLDLLGTEPPEVSELAHQPEPQCLHYREEFPDRNGVSCDMGKGKTFMDLFNEDTYAEERHHNIYYPFASQAEWQLASFLLKSGLSMVALDEFFKLDLVSISLFCVFLKV